MLTERFDAQESTRAARTRALMRIETGVSHFMSLQIDSVRKRLAAVGVRTCVRLFASMGAKMTPQCAFFSECFRASVACAGKRSLASMLFVVALQAETSVKALTTRRMRASELSVLAIIFGVVVIIVVLVVLIIIVVVVVLSSRGQHGKAAGSGPIGRRPRGGRCG